MTSKGAPKEAPKEAYVWVWLPEATEPVVAGLIERDGNRYVFNYGRSYLARKTAIPLYLPELPLQQGAIPPLGDLALAGCLRDAAPDAWGRRVIINRMFGTKGAEVDVNTVDELTYLLESGSDRIGALDFQTSGSKYEPRVGSVASLEELLSVAERVEKGVPITPELERAIFHGTSLGGARPKAAIETADAKFIAKFSSSNDITNVVKGEFIAMRLAAKLGLNVAETKLERAGGKDVLLVKRFDREKTEKGWQRRAMVSALTMLGLDEMVGRHASYRDIAEIIRTRFAEPKKTLHELYGRLVFNVLCGNTDDHARNHAAFWDGSTLNLTPAYDICPQTRRGREANQAMAITDNKRASTLATCIEAAPQFLLSENAATVVIETQIRGIRSNWDQVCKEAAISQVDEGVLKAGPFLNPYAFEGAPESISKLKDA
jgi:serine/threonine-protein kinase HipA